MRKVHVEWGERALDQEAEIAVIVDCLSFSSALSVACARGAIVYPFGLREGAKHFAAFMGLDIVGKRKEQGLSLSPSSLDRLNASDKIVLPSPNGSNLTLFAKQPHVLGGALRNAKAVAQAIDKLSGDVVIVAAGERWPADGSLRPAFEDWIAAGAIVSYLGAGFALSAEAKLALSSYQSVASNLHQSLVDCLSGQELIQLGFAEDVEWAAQLNANTIVPTLVRQTQTYADLGLQREDVPSAKVLQTPVCYYEAR